MNKYSVRKYYFVDIIVEASNPEEANEKAGNVDIDLRDLEYLGDLEYSDPDVVECF